MTLHSPSRTGKVQDQRTRTRSVAFNEVQYAAMTNVPISLVKETDKNKHHNNATYLVQLNTEFFDRFTLLAGRSNISERRQGNAVFESIYGFSLDSQSSLCRATNFGQLTLLIAVTFIFLSDITLMI